MTEERAAPRAAVERGRAPGIIVTPATAGDLDRVAAIEGASFGDPWSRHAFERLLGDERVFFSVACAPRNHAARHGDTAAPDGEGSVVVGYVAAWFIMDEGEIANLAVAPEARGHGIGALLLDSAIAAARARGVSAVYLEVRDSNVPARRLYASRGFTEVGRRRRYYRRPVEDALVLRLVLPAP